MSLQNQNSSKRVRNILVISRVFPPDIGGIQEYTYNRCLQDQDRVIVLTAKCSGSEEFDRSQLYPIHRWPIPKTIDYFFNNAGYLGSIVKQIYYILSSLISGILLYQRYQYQYIEWCHGYDFPAILILSYILPIRYFIYLHGNDLLCCLGNSLIKYIFKLTINRAEGVIYNSSCTKSILEYRLNVSTKCYVINPSVRPEKFGKSRVLDLAPRLRSNLRKAFNIPDEAIVILSVGRLIKRKGIKKVIETIPLLLQENIDIYYLICGQGIMQNELHYLVEKIGLENRVRLMGYVPDNQLADYYCACDFYVMPTEFDKQTQSIEGYGIVYSEAAYFGKPAIASRIGGTEDAVRHEESGLLIDPESDTELTNALRRLCKDKQLRQKFGLTAQKMLGRQEKHSIIYQI